MTIPKMLAVGALLAAAGLSPQAQQPATQRPQPGAANPAAAAAGLLATLDQQQQSRVRLPLNEMTRRVWSNLPSGVRMQVGATERNGLTFGSLSAAQQEAALALVASVLSPAGYAKVIDIVNADQRLEETSAPTRAPTAPVRFGRAEFSIAILGAPAGTGKWILQFGGHHLAINVTVAGAERALTPSHTGTQPASYQLNGETIRPLGKENDKAFALMAALDAGQQKQALLGYEVRNLVLGPGEDGKVIQPEGIPGSALTQPQRRMLRDLIAEWVNILSDPSASSKMREVDSNLGVTYFAWSGSTTNGRPAYFRVQGPTVLIEYAPQVAASATSADHIHTIYRDPTNDYGQRMSP
jgi:hypothetical protein